MLILLLSKSKSYIISKNNGNLRQSDKEITIFGLKLVWNLVYICILIFPCLYWITRIELNGWWILRTKISAKLLTNIRHQAYDGEISHQILNGLSFHFIILKW